MQNNSNMAEQPDFIQRQYAFAARIRDPENAPAPGDVPARRMAVYEELFYNNVQDFLANAFPVIRSLLSDQAWHEMVRDYFVKHRAHTPLFHEMPRELLHYLEDERGDRDDDFPFLKELAHYEWIELELLTADASEPAYTRDANLLQAIPVLSPLSRLLSYNYPVHRIGPDNIPNEPGKEQTHILVYRDREDEVQFMELNPLTALLLQQLAANQNHSSETVLRQIAEALHHPNPDIVIQGGAAILHDLVQRGFILGSRPEGEIS